MEPITYTNIVVEGVPFTKVLALEIAHAINEHGTAAIVGEMEVDAAREYHNPDENGQLIPICVALVFLLILHKMCSSHFHHETKYHNPYHAIMKSQPMIRLLTTIM